MYEQMGPKVHSLNVRSKLCMIQYFPRPYTSESLATQTH